MDLAYILIFILIFAIGNCRGGPVPTHDIEPDNEESIRKRNPDMSDQEIEYCLEYEADYWDIDIDILRLTK